MKQKTAAARVIEMMEIVANRHGAEMFVPDICNRHGVPVTHESIMVRITNNRPRFPMWDFYTRTCQQTGAKIIGARPIKQEKCPQHEYAEFDNYEPMLG